MVLKLGVGGQLGGELDEQAVPNLTIETSRALYSPSACPSRLYGHKLGPEALLREHKFTGTGFWALCDDGRS